MQEIVLKTGESIPIDKNTNRLYNAERWVEFYYKSPKIESPEHCKYIWYNMVHARFWEVFDIYKPLLFDFKNDPALDGCYYFQPKFGYIEISDTGRNLSVLLHEIAHHIAFTKLNANDNHGPLFANTLILLMKYVVGTHTANELESAFKAFKVRL